MTLGQLECEKDRKITIQEAAAIMKITPRFLQMALQQNRFDFGTAVKFSRWSYYINTERFIQYMRAQNA